jgi:hypothetical protein
LEAVRIALSVGLLANAVVGQLAIRATFTAETDFIARVHSAITWVERRLPAGTDLTAGHVLTAALPGISATTSVTLTNTATGLRTVVEERHRPGAMRALSRTGPQWGLLKLWSERPTIVRVRAVVTGSVSSANPMIDASFDGAVDLGADGTWEVVPFVADARGGNELELALPAGFQGAFSVQALALRPANGLELVGSAGLDVACR